MRFELSCGITFVLGLSAAGTAVAQDAVPSPDRSVIYRETGGQSLSAYVFLPAGHRPGQPADGILLFHGGGWSAGTPEWTFATSRRFADWGLVAIAVQYRLSEGDITPIEALDDVCTALAWAREQADDLGLTGRLAGYGVSAGGHLIAATATVGCAGGVAGPDALLLWSPALDVAADGWFRKQLRGRAEVAVYSPVEHVGPSTPPTSIVHGSEDTLTPVAGARRYCDRLLRTGAICDLNIYEGVGHLLTRNLANQESDFDPDPHARADGIERHRRFLVQLGFISVQ
jgi:acetyl esterase/lipase